MKRRKDIIKKKNKIYTEEFKHQIVKLHASGKTSVELEHEYGVSKTSVNTWVKRYSNSGKFSVLSNLTESEKELRQLRKDNKQLRMESQTRCP
ncbi:MAG: transposase [Oscillospiraceae bacterium]|nr:transposase [Oscillospiraceae bacterium]